MQKTSEQVLLEKGVLCRTTVGVSMLPLLRAGKDVSFIERKDPPFRKYDAVLFRREDGTLILHRILTVRPDGMYRIVGDNCETAEWVREEDILGVLTRIRRGEKIIEATSLRYRLYARLQGVAFPIRRLYRRYRRRVLRLWQCAYHRIRKK